MKSFELLRDLPMMVHSIDTDGKIVEVNDYWLKVLGYKKDEVLGCLSTDFLTEESKRFSKIILPVFYEEKNVKSIPYQFVTKSGETLSVLMSAILVKGSNGNTFSIAISTEVTNIIKGYYISPSENDSASCFEMNKRLIKLRHDNGVTQERMAEVLNTSLRTYQRLEHGEAHLTVVDLHKIAESFNVSALRILMSKNTYEHKGMTRVLLVEDEKVLAGIFHDDLKSWGFDVDVAHNGSEALELLKVNSYDVLITDIDMPEMNGFELIYFIKRSVIFDVRKIIVVSGLNESIVKKKVPEDVTIFEKPISITELKKSLLEAYVAYETLPI